MLEVNNFRIDIGEMSYGFDILGMNFLQKTGSYY